MHVENPGNAERRGLVSSDQGSQESLPGGANNRAE